MRQTSRICLVLLLISTAALNAAEIPPERLHQAEAQYNSGNYPDAIRWLHSIHGMLSPIPKLTLLNAPTRARVYFDLGCCYLGAKDFTMAEQAFRRAFLLDAGLKAGHFQNADPGTFWRDLLNQKENTRRLKTTTPGALMRSVVIPGWGQLYRGHKKKGAALLGASAVTAGIWAMQYYSFCSARNTYQSTPRQALNDVASKNEDGTEYSAFEARHRVARSRAKTANRTLAIFGAIWLLGLTDSIASGPGQIDLTVSF